MSTDGPPGNGSGEPADARAEDMRTGSGDGRRDRRGRGQAAPSPTPWQPSAPSTATLEVLRGRLPLSIRLIGRSSVPGAVLVVVIALLFVGAVPLAAKLQLNAAQASGDVIPIGNLVTLTVANDWTIESQDGRATVLSSGSSQVVIVPAYRESRPAEQVARAELSTLGDSGNASWVVGEPTAFTTDDGDRGVTLAASSETSAVQVWVVTHDGYATMAVLTSTIESWASAAPRVQEMVDSVAFSNLPEDAGS